MTTSTTQGPDQAHTLIRISPKRIKTHVRQTLRYRPLRSLCLLGLLVLLSLFILFTLSQMAIVQHTMMTHLGRGSAHAGDGLLTDGRGRSGSGSGAGAGRGAWGSGRNGSIGIGTMGSSGQGSSRESKKAPSKQGRGTFNQFKIEPLLVRNAPSVEVNTAQIINRRLAKKAANIIVRMSRLPDQTDPSDDPSLDPLIAAGDPHGLLEDTAISSILNHQKGSTNQASSYPRHDVHGSSTNGEEVDRKGSTAGTSEGEKGREGVLEKEREREGVKYGTEEALRTGGVTSVASDGSDVGLNKQNTRPLSALEEHAMAGPKSSSAWYEPIDRDGDKDSRPLSTATNANAKLSEEQLRKLPLCPEIPPGLMGRLNVDLDRLEKLVLNDVLEQLSWVGEGGTWSPVMEPHNPCLPRHKVAVVLPYRDRLHHLTMLLSWLHPILRRQQLEYTIFVAEQTGNTTFNKGSIMNAGFMEAWQRGDFSCFIFHDVDLLPEDDRNMYSCPPQPRHLSVGVDTLGYKLPYFLLVGGVLCLRSDQFMQLNGYSNMYWGWGGEDDDMGYRIKQSALSITRPPNSLARYTMVRHTKRRPLTWKVRGKLLRTSRRRYKLDGLNTLKYKLQAVHLHPLFTHLLLDVGTPPENLMRLDNPAKPSPPKT